MSVTSDDGAWLNDRDALYRVFDELDKESLDFETSGALWPKTDDAVEKSLSIGIVGKFCSTNRT